MTPEQITIWHFIQIYKTEAVNLDYGFNAAQSKELLDLMKISEKNYKSFRPGKINKSNMAFHNFDIKFIEYGGNIDKLSEKVDMVYTKIDSKITRIADAAMKTPQLLKKLRLKRFKQ